MQIQTEKTAFFKPCSTKIRHYSEPKDPLLMAMVDLRENEYRSLILVNSFKEAGQLFFSGKTISNIGDILSAVIDPNKKRDLI